MADHFIPIQAGIQKQQRQLAQSLREAASERGRRLVLTGLAGGVG